VLGLGAPVLHDVLQVHVDNDTYDDRTIITVDSANRPGTLVEVVQCLTELGLNVKKARISSDGG
jgi:UTP:GlnB (protein PII) uridylyltransferase